MSRCVQELHVSKFFTIANGMYGQLLLQDVAMSSYVAPIVVTPLRVIGGAGLAPILLLFAPADLDYRLVQG